MAANELEGKTALITGASSGIGEASAGALAEKGANVVLAARREGELEDIAQAIESEYDQEALVVPTDVAEEGEVESLVEETVERFGGLDVVLANAGMGTTEPVAEMPTESYRTMIGVNVDGAFFTARAAIPHLKESVGNLIFMGSFAGQYPRPNAAVYAATKWWVRGFAHSLEGSIGEEDVAVTVINPTEVTTEFGSEGGTSMEERFEEGEVTSPKEIADAVAFAASQRPPTTTSEIDLYRRDKFEHF
jgi:NADP-dependent 3-hydroxy acid dehydrogenase YdfG